MTSTTSDKESATRITGAGVAASAGIILATVLTGAYIFEYQYLSTFGIPGQLARVGTEQLAFAVAGLFVVGVLVGIVAAAGRAISDSLKGDYGMIPLFAVFAALGGALALVFLGSIPGFTEAILLLISIYLVGQFGLPLLDKKSRQSWRRYTHGFVPLRGSRRE